MKKLFVMFVATASLALVSCSGEGNNNQSNDSIPAAEQVAAKAIEFDADAFKAKLDEAIKAGDKAAVAQVLEEAKAKIDEEKTKPGAQREAIAGLWAQIKQAVDERAAELKKLGVDEAVSKITNVDEELKQDVDAAVQKAVEQGKQAAQDAVEQGKQAAQEAVEQGKQAAQDAANKAVEQGKQAAQEAADKGKQAAQDAADKAKQAAQNAAKNIPGL